MSINKITKLGFKLNCFLSITLILACCSSKNVINSNDSTKKNIVATWVVDTVNYVGNGVDFKVSDEVNFGTLFGGWADAKGEKYTFKKNLHWHTTMLDGIDQDSFTYKLKDSLLININHGEEEYSFYVKIINLDDKSMAWDIGNDIHILFQKLKPASQ